MAGVFELFRLDDRVAIVTGGAGRLGFQMGSALNEAGAHVVLASRNTARCKEKAAQLAGPACIGLHVDITEKDTVQAMVADVLKHFGRIDILVNNAGGAVLASFETMSPEEFRKTIDLNQTGTFLCSQAVLDPMKRQGKGAIVNIASIYGVVGADQRIYEDSGLNSPINYAAAKGGVVNMTRYMASYLAPYKIRVNGIGPGGFFEVTDKNRGFAEHYFHRTMLGRQGSDTDLKGAILYLTSDASAYVTGHTLMVDGGWTAW